MDALRIEARWDHILLGGSGRQWWGAACRGVEGQSRDGEGVRVQNFYRLTKIYISFVCTLGEKGEWGGREVERERERD